MKKFRQIIQNFAYSGELTNTTVIEWETEKRQGDARNATAEDLQQIGDAAAAGYLAQIAALNAEIEELKAGPRPSVGEISKLTLMRRLDALGKWSAFKALLTQLPEVVQDAWTLASGIRADDPLFVEYAPTIQAALGLTDEQFAALLA